MKKYILGIFIIINLTGCTTIKQKYTTQEKYMIIRKFSGKTDIGTECSFLIKCDKKRKYRGELTSPLIGNAVIIGDIEFNKIDDNIEFNIDSLKFFSNWYNGWTEGKISAIGKLIIKNKNESWKFEKKEDFEIIEITEGQIRYFDDYYRGEEGLKKVKDRMDRIFSVVDFLKKESFPDHFGNFKYNTESGSSFNNTIQPFLFPETKCFKKKYKEKKLPEKYYIKEVKDNLKNTDNNTAENFKWTIGFDLLWELNYTNKIFPENLRDIRNSGSMWRDYEEAGDLYFMVYNLKYFYNIQLVKYNFKRYK